MTIFDEAIIKSKDNNNVHVIVVRHGRAALTVLTTQAIATTLDKEKLMGFSVQNCIEQINREFEAANETEICGIPIMSKANIIKKLEEEEKTRDKQKYGADGILEIGRKTFEYKNVKYDVAILQYYTLWPIKLGGRSGGGMGMNRVSSKHAVVEVPKETEMFRNKIIKITDNSDFLWHDTNHSWHDKMTIEEQIEECHDLAKQDIDNLPEILKEAGQKVKDLQADLEGLKLFVKEAK